MYVSPNVNLGLVASAADMTTLIGRLTAGRATNLDLLAIIGAGGAGELTPARAALLTNLDAAITSRMTSIKSVQRGTVNASATANTSTTAAITSVTVAKCWSTFNQRTGYLPLGTNLEIASAVGELTNATTITVYSAANPANSTLGAQVKYEVVEVN